MSKNGFTLLEILVVVTIVSILSAIAIPELSEMKKNQSINDETRHFILSLNQSKSEAVLKKKNVIMLADSPLVSNEWGNGGWTLSLDAAVFKNHEVDSKVNIDSDVGVSMLTFTSTNNVIKNAESRAIAAPINFDFCDDRTQERGKRITLNGFGRITHQTITCD